VRLERTRELEGEECVPTRLLVDAASHRTRERHAEPLAEQALNRTEAQRADVDPLEIARAVEHHRWGRVAALRQQHPDPLSARAPQREREGGAARAVEPLDVVDRNHERRLACEPPEKLEDADGDRPRIERSTLGVLEQESHGERPPLRHRQLRDLMARPRQLVGKPGERQLALRLGGPRFEHPVPALPSACDPDPPQLRLSDPGLPLEHERRRAERDAVEEARETRQLDLTTENLAHSSFSVHVADDDRRSGR
jgi:hypothetical protein